MTFEEANRIPLEDILLRLGHKPSTISSSDLWYLSPLRAEKTPSFHVTISKNVWYDFGEGMGGSVIDFVCAHLASHNEDHTLIDALRWIENMKPQRQFPHFEKKRDIENDVALLLQSHSQLKEIGLLRYLEMRGIPVELAKRHLRQVRVLNKKTGKSFYALALQNVDEGYELKNKLFKGSIGSKAISFVRGEIPPRSVHLFEGMMDFLSAIQLQESGKFEGDAIILNSLSCLPQALPYIRDYTYRDVYTWFDNDAAGHKATLQLQEAISHEPKMTFRTMNNLYAGHKDVNEWHLKKKR